MTKLRDQPSFRTFGYWPNTPSQWREATIDDCGWYSGEFAWEAADTAHRSYHPVRDLRDKSSDTEGGVPLSVMLKDINGLWPSDGGVGYTYGAYDEERIAHALECGATIIWGGDYERLPEHYRRWTNNDNFDHALASRFFRADQQGVMWTAMYDPLGGGPTREKYDGEWIPLPALLKFSWRTGSNFWVAIVDNLREVNKMINLTIKNNAATAQVRLNKRTTIQALPSAASDIRRKIWSDEKWWDRIGSTGGGWNMVTWLENEILEFGYVHRDDILAWRQAPDEPTGNEDTEKIAKIRAILA